MMYHYKPLSDETEIVHSHLIKLNGGNKNVCTF